MRSFADAQDDKGMLSHLVAFWSILVDLLNEYVGVNDFIAPAWGADFRPWVLLITPSESPGRMDIPKQDQWLG